MRKLIAKWVPRLLVIDEKRQRVCDSKSCLDLFNRNPSDFLPRLVTINETWIHHYKPESRYFGGLENLHYKSGIEMLKDRRDKCIELKGLFRTYSLKMIAGRCEISFVSNSIKLSSNILEVMEEYGLTI